MNARDRVSALTRSFDEQDAAFVTADPLAFEGYADQLARARDDTGLNDACIWGWADIADQRCALVVFDFAFLGGSMGTVVGEKVARAFDAARRTRRTIVTITASGGARMQEGMWSLVQMAKTVEARRAHSAAGLAHIALLTSPTTGGVYASFASLADVVYAEKDATIGFAGPRVVEQLTGTAPPPDVHTAEYAFAHGLIDAVIEHDEASTRIAGAVHALATRLHEPERLTPVEAMDEKHVFPDPWERLQIVRDPGRPKGADVLNELLADNIELRGDRSGESDDEHVVVRAGCLRGTAFNAIGVAQQTTGDGRIRPQGFRKAIRAIELAGRLHVPLITVIDTRGADPLPSSEAGGIAFAIAKTFDAMLNCPAPTVAVLIGEGGSGGALAMTPADSVVVLSNAVFSVIAPEGAAAILYRDASRAPELATKLGIGVEDLVTLGLVDAVVPEPPAGVILDAQVIRTRLVPAVAGEVDRLVGSGARRRLVARHSRWRNIAPAQRGRAMSRRRPKGGSRAGP